MKKLLKFILFSFIFFGVFQTQAQKTWVGANNGNWNVASNWSPNGVPSASDNVIFNTNRNINVDINTTINRLTITNNAVVSFTSSGGARTITIDNTGSSIDTGSSLELRGTTGGGGTRTMSLVFSGTSLTMNIAGTLNATAVGAGSVLIVQIV